MKSKILIRTISALITLGVHFSNLPTHAFEGSGLTTVTSTYSTTSICDSSSQTLETEMDYQFSDLSGQTFKTDRLTITPTSDEDLETIAEYLLDKDVTKYLDPCPTVKKGFETKEDALNFLKGEEKSDSGNALEFTIKLSEAQDDIPALTPIGKIDLMLYEKSMVAIGYCLGKDFQGKGYMSEASFELCNKAFQSSDVKTLYICCDVENKSSSNLARKICDYIERANEDMNLFRDMGEYNARDIVNGEETSFDFFQLTLQKQN